MDTSMLGRINALRRMTVDELRDEWFRQYREPTRSRNKQFLFRRLAWRLQELQHGGLSDKAKARINDLAPDGFTRARTPREAPDVAVAAAQQPNDAPTTGKATRDPRLPTSGTVITRTYRGRELRLVVLDDGFELDGTRHGSLSEAARAVTGQHWSGPLFWGLRKRSRS